MRKLLVYALMVCVIPLVANARSYKLGADVEGSSKDKGGRNFDIGHCQTNPCQNACSGRGCVVDKDSKGNCKARCVDCNKDSDCDMGKYCNSSNQCIACVDGDVCVRCTDPEKPIWHNNKCTKPVCDIPGCHLCEADNSSNCKTCEDGYYRREYESGKYDCISCKGKYSVENGACSACDESRCTEVSCDSGYMSYDDDGELTCIKENGACAATSCGNNLFEKVSYNNGRKCCCEMKKVQIQLDTTGINEGLTATSY